MLQHKWTIFSATLLSAVAGINSASAQITNLEALQTQPMSQVTNVNQLRDVEPTAWAYEALRSLVERYGCLVGYPERTYRGNRALSRWEFAAGLNACLNTLERLIKDGVAVLKDDIDKLKRLAQEFESELAVLGTRVDNLEQRVAFLEDHQFSTTTKLSGEVIFGLFGVVAGEKNGGEDIDRVPALGYRTRLEFNTSFTGQDLLRLWLSSGNIGDSVDQTGTFQDNLSYASDTENQVVIDWLFYQFPVAENAYLWLEAFGGVADDFTPTLNILDGDGGSGAISSFGTRSLVYRTSGQTGIGFNGNFGGIDISLGYLAGNAGDPSQGNGLFNGSYSAIGQIGYIPDENFGIAFTYVHGYNQLDTETGSRRSNLQFFTDDRFGEAVTTVENAYGIEATLRLSENIVLGGWGGYTQVRTLDTLDGQLERGDLDIWTWAVTLAFPDLFKEGSMGGIIVGMQPWVSNSSIDEIGNDHDTSIHIEAFYEYAITDNLKVTPGMIVITAPDYNDNNAPLVIGTIRTTFTF